MSTIIFTNRKLKKIVNVYQFAYKNHNSPGLGDFLRGCFHLMQLSDLLNIQFDLDISNHPLSNYVENVTCIEGIDYNNITFYLDVNHHKKNYEDFIENINKGYLNKFITYLNNQDCEVFGLFSNSFPFFNKHTDEGKKFIKSKFLPNSEMRNYIDHTLNQLYLNKNNYNVIHIRIGDEYIINKYKTDLIYFDKIKQLLLSISDKNSNYLIISDSNNIKKYVMDIPNFYIINNEIQHLGGEIMQNTTEYGIRDTMLDFFLMSYSNSIISLSRYNHVSGFSRYCSIIHNIPFKYIKINDLI
jgi:hypothetical protein